MICPKCKNQLPDGVNFCKFCGVRFTQSNAQPNAQQSASYVHRECPYGERACVRIKGTTYAHNQIRTSETFGWNRANSSLHPDTA